ncbi:hypothetical protein [Flavobacterium sp.]|uniref:hypothetical protein n=1 Tax=Flavobacterium sp. TaxID=239 RepID=UPI0025CBE186|nr:hypothetical protein [Flavobacterium sp.]
MITILTLINILFSVIIIYLITKIIQERQKFKSKIADLEKFNIQISQHQKVQNNQLQLSEELQEKLFQINATLSKDIYEVNFKLVEELYPIK